VAGKHGAVVEEGFYSNLAKPSVQAGKREKILAVHVQRESHDPSQDHSDPKWRKCESFQGNGLRGWRPERAMDLMDQPRTSIDERMLSGRRAVVIV